MTPAALHIITEYLEENGLDSDSLLIQLGSAGELSRDQELSEALSWLRIVMTTDSRDWARARKDAVLYGVLVGWECEGVCCDPGDPSHSCDDALREVALKHFWGVEGVADVRRRRAAIRRVVG